MEERRKEEKRWVDFVYSLCTAIRKKAFFFFGAVRAYILPGVTTLRCTAVFRSGGWRAAQKGDAIVGRS